MPTRYEEAFAKAQELAVRSDVFLVLGTSLTVYPAAGLPRLARQAGARGFIVNGSPTAVDDAAAFCGRDLAVFAEAVLAAFPGAGGSAA